MSDYMQDRMPKCIPERTSEYMPKRMAEFMPERMSDFRLDRMLLKVCQRERECVCQHRCQIECQDVPNRTPEVRMSELMPDRTANVCKIECESKFEIDGSQRECQKICQVERQYTCEKICMYLYVR